MKIEINIFERRGKRHKRRAVTSQFAGAYYVNSKGDIVVAQQTVPGATALTGQLIFKDQNGNLIAGPVGAIASTDSANPPSLSSDGQSYNLTSPAATGADQTVTLTWTDPSGKVPGATQDFIVAAVIVLAAASVEFGLASPGTTP